MSPKMIYEIIVLRTWDDSHYLVGTYERFLNYSFYSTLYRHVGHHSSCKNRMSLLIMKLGGKIRQTEATQKKLDPEDQQKAFV
jgi:hypothetical protein